MTEWNTNALIAAEPPSPSLRGGFVRGKINLSNSGLYPLLVWQSSREAGPPSAERTRLACWR